MEQGVESRSIAPRRKGFDWITILYGCGYVACVGYMIIFPQVKRTSWVIPVIEVLVALCFGIGFCARAAPFVRRFLTNSVGIFVVTVFQAVVLVLANVLAKHMVTDAMRLPSGDFPSTLAMWTLLCVVPVWLKSMAIIGIAALVLFFFTAGLTALTASSPLGYLLRGMSKFLPISTADKIMQMRERDAWTLRTWGHVLGAVIFMLVVIEASDRFQSAVRQPSMIRLFAFWADYESVPDYPGVDEARLRLHDNGVVSYATLSGMAVELRRDRVREKP